MSSGEATGSWTTRNDAIGATVYAFEREHRAARDPRIEDYLGSVEGSDRLALLLELVHSELELRLAAGLDAGLDGYLARFPALADAPDRLAAILETEVRLRRDAGRPVDAAEYEARYGPLGLPVGTILRGATPRLPEVPGYEVLSELGRGAMGVVYEARQVDLDRIVALKMVLAGPHAGPGELDRFRAEALAVARIGNPGIVQVFEIGEADGLPYIALEYVGGGDLKEHLGGAPIPAAEAAGLALAISRAVAAAHRAGVVHRDLKPANVLMTPEGEPKVADFGLAKRLGGESGRTGDGAMLGTPCYMSPEQAGGRNGQVGPGADVYALGAILYEMLAGRPPFQAATVGGTLRMICDREPVPPSRLQSGVPRDLETICLKCLEKEPPRRYPSAEALADDLRRFLDGRPVLARRAGPARRAWMWTRRNPLAASALLAIRSVAADAVAREQARRSRRMFELGRIRQAHESWEAGDLRAARRRLGQVSAEFRGWEWRHLDLLCRSSPGLVVTTDPAAAPYFEFIGRGDRYVVPAGANSIAVRRSADGSEIHRLSLGSPLAALAIDGQGRRIAAADEAGVLYVWDLVSGSLLPQVKARGKPDRLVFSADGSRVGVLDEMHRWAWVLDLASGRILFSSEEWRGRPVGVGPILDLALSPDLSQHATVTLDEHEATNLRVWRIDQPEAVWSLPLRWPKRPGSTGEPPRTIPPDANAPLRFSRDGSLVLCRPPSALEFGDGDGPIEDARRGDAQANGAGRLGIFDATTGRPAPQPERLNQGLLSPDDRLLLLPRAANGVDVTELATGRELAVLKGPGYLWRFGPRSDLLAQWSEAEVRFWDLDSSSVRLSHAPDRSAFRGDYRGIVFSPDGSRYAMPDGPCSVTVRELPSGRVIQTLWRLSDSPVGETPPRADTWPENLDGFRGPMRFSPDGRWLAICGETMQLFRIDGRGEPSSVEVQMPSGNNLMARNADQSAFSPDGRSWLERESAPRGFLLRRYGLDDGVEQSIRFEDEEGVSGWLVPRPGLVLLGKMDGGVSIRKDGREPVPRRIHDGPVMWLDALPDGSLFASAAVVNPADPADFAAGPEDQFEEYRHVDAPPKATKDEQVGFINGVVHGGYADMPTGPQLREGVAPKDTLPGQTDLQDEQDKAELGNPGSAGEVVQWAVWGPESAAPPRRGRFAVGRSLNPRVRLLRGGSRLLLSLGSRSIYLEGGEWHSPFELRLFDLSAEGRLIYRFGNLEAADRRLHPKAVNSYAVSNDGELIALGHRDGTLIVREVGTERQILSLPAHTGGVGAVAFAPDAQRVATAGSGGDVRLWDLQTGMEVLALRRTKGDPITTLAFSPQGTRLVGAALSGVAKHAWHASP
ncbi:WD40 repeat domain-containing serine/threonine protein kinase [Paludisphaera soli]|uniref:WD40 repeat domain-containing serine/threonine protein kinase n=1 Tax=Paludisphaera soli TaxID=2712865 RepID=UPI0013EB7065|nr:serine/threonine-protein kinase [Paludisphaera soli]